MNLLTELANLFIYYERPRLFLDTSKQVEKNLDCASFIQPEKTRINGHKYDEIVQDLPICLKSKDRILFSSRIKWLPERNISHDGLKVYIQLRKGSARTSAKNWQKKLLRTTRKKILSTMKSDILI